MKAAIINAYGSADILQVLDVRKPKIKSNEILVQVKAFAVTSADSRIRGARFPKGFGLFARLVFGITKPRNKILGSTYSGVIEQVGSQVNTFKVGDEVCGMTGVKMGTYAEYVKIGKLKSIVKKPHGVSHQEAAALLFGGTAALYFIRDKLAVKKGETVLINGASGAVGTNAVQLAKLRGAHVTAVASGDNAKLVQQLGADTIIDYMRTNVNDLDQTYDVVLDTVGNITPQVAKKLLAHEGRAGLMVASFGDTIKARGQIIVGTATEKSEDIAYLIDLVAKKKINVIVHKVYGLEDIVSAHKYVDSGKKTGNIVVQI